MKQRIQKVKNHLAENGELYFMYGCGVAAGIIVTKIWTGTAKPEPKQIVTTANVVNAWLEGVHAGGKHVFMLNDLQADIWRNAWEAAKTAAHETRINNPDYLRGMVEGSRRAIAMGA